MDGMDRDDRARFMGISLIKAIRPIGILHGRIRIENMPGGGEIQLASPGGLGGPIPASSSSRGL